LSTRDPKARVQFPLREFRPISTRAVFDEVIAMKDWGIGAVRFAGVIALFAMLTIIPGASAKDENLGTTSDVPVVKPPPNIGNVITPYRFSPGPKNVSPADEQKALNYRAQLQGQERDLEQLHSDRSHNPFQRQMLKDTQSELNRINGVLHP